MNKTSTGNEPISIWFIALGLFFAHYVSVSVGILTVEEYFFDGKWTTIPNYESLVMSDNVITRLYHRFMGWDGHWYYHISINGYLCEGSIEKNNPFECNVSFFPMLPMLGALLGKIGIPQAYGLPLISQFAWLSSLLVTAKVLTVINKKPNFLLGAILLASYPGALYLYVSYSESLLMFLFIGCGFLTMQYLQCPKNKTLWLLFLCVVAATLTKVTGLAAMGIPLVAALCEYIRKNDNVSLCRNLILVSIMGVVVGLTSFLAYCEYVFGAWDIYFRYVSDGWGQGANIKYRFIFLDTVLNISRLVYFPNRLAVILALVLIGVLLFLGYTLSKVFKSTPSPIIGMFSVALVGLTFHIWNLGGDYSWNYNFIRRSLPYVGLLTVVYASTLELPTLTAFRKHIVLSLGFLCLISFSVQFSLVQIFARGNWVS